MDIVYRRVVLSLTSVFLVAFSSTLWAQGPSLQIGKAVYEQNCAYCHGKGGQGDGPAASALNLKPRDLTEGRYKFRSTESGSIPTDADLMATVRNGLRGTSMPAWAGYVGDDSIKAVVEYVKSLSPRFKSEKPRVVSMGAAVPSSAASIAAGKRAYEKLQCGACHGSDGEGTNAVQREFVDDWGRELPIPNLTEPWSFRGGSTARDVYLRFRTGLDGTPMPSYVGTASETEMWHLANYVLSLARKPVWAMNEAEAKAFYETQQEKLRKDPVTWGRYLVESKGCGDCHTPFNPDGSLITEFQLAGGQRWEVKPYATFYPKNLTSDEETGLGSLTDDQIRLALTRGIRRDGSRMLPFPMPWPVYASLRDDEVKAIIAYLRSLPPVYNKVPIIERPNIFSYLWMKFRMLILKEPFPAFIHSGNAGQPKTQAATNTSENQPLTEARP
jgi:mono/diheme cytochrome c family protein